jgi:WD40 repeat protein
MKTQTPIKGWKSVAVTFKEDSLNNLRSIEFSNGPSCATKHQQDKIQHDEIQHEDYMLSIATHSSQLFTFSLHHKEQLTNLELAQLQKFDAPTPASDKSDRNILWSFSPDDQLLLITSFNSSTIHTWKRRTEFQYV